MDPESGILSKSILFEARKATSASPSSSYSSRIHDLMKLKSERGMSEIDAEIEASKTHWTEVESNWYYTPPTSAREESSTSETGGESCKVEMTEEERAELYKDNLEEMRRLQKEYEKSEFFEIGGKVTGKMIAKGGQATIYGDWEDRGDDLLPWVWKVFDAGYYVRKLRTQWPIAMLQRLNLENCYDLTVDKLRNGIYSACLLDDGRFVFGMFRYWGDVRKLLDVRMQHNGNRYPPFMREDGTYQECVMLMMWRSIAMGMKGIHDEGTLHRDLKTSNVLIDKLPKSIDEKVKFNPLKLDGEFLCFVADYECSMGVQGIGFWRASEILEALRNGTLNTTPNAFTQKVDVYGYVMTCYEILTGRIPFEHPEDVETTIDNVIEGKRPTLPQHLKSWVVKFFHGCWH